MADLKDLSTGMFVNCLLKISNGDMLRQTLNEKRLSMNHSPIHGISSRIHIIGIALFLIFIAGNCSPNRSATTLDGQTGCDMVNCVKRKYEYVWDRQVNNYLRKDVGCQTYDVDTRCMYQGKRGKKKTVGEVPFKPVIGFSVLSCVRRLVASSQYSVMDAHVLCRKTLKQIENDPTVKLKKDVCIQEALRSGLKVNHAIERCYY